MSCPATPTRFRAQSGSSKEGLRPPERVLRQTRIDSGEPRGLRPPERGLSRPRHERRGEPVHAASEGYFAADSIFGVTKTSSSVWFDERMLERNRRPIPGMEPR